MPQFYSETFLSFFIYSLVTTFQGAIAAQQNTITKKVKIKREKATQRKEKTQGKKEKVIATRTLGG